MWQVIFLQSSYENIAEGLMLMGKHIFVTLPQTCVLDLVHKPAEAPVCLSVRMEQLRNRWTDFHDLMGRFSCLSDQAVLVTGLRAALCIFLHSFENKFLKYAWKQRISRNNTLEN
jgi:hypothetical protein